jgi:alkylation response protein AidB-like acyl-CoA dehydrogenase
MNFELSEEHLMIRQAARDFAQNELKEGVIERDSKCEYPEKQVKRMAELGFLGMTVSTKYGGGGMDTISYALAVEEISKIDNSCSVILSAHNSLACWGIEEYGTEEQKEKFLKPLAIGKKIGAFCLSEPESGSDATQQKTTAIDKGDHYVLNGVKNWITNGLKADIYVVIAQSNLDLGHRGINAFVIDSDTNGISCGPKEDKLGIRSSDTCSVIFQDVIVPKENKLGPEGFGFKYAMKTLEGGRIGIAAQALGLAEGAYEMALEYSKQRKTFGKAISQHQGIAFKLADMATDIEAARLLVHKSAINKDKNLDYGYSSSMAKLYASEMAMKHTVEAVQIHGGNGFVKEYHVERLMRDAKITQIYEGTSEIQKIIISRKLLK